MPLDPRSVAEIFAVLSVRYGSAFTNKFEGINPAALHADWAHVLEGIPGYALRHGLDNLDPKWPPTATEFRDICRTARHPAAPPPPMLPRMTPAEEEAHMEHQKRMAHDVKAKLAALKFRAPSLEWARELRERREAGEHLHISQLDALKAVEHLLDATEAPAPADFKGIPRDALPPRMR